MLIILGSGATKVLTFPLWESKQGSKIWKNASSVNNVFHVFNLGLTPRPPKIIDMINITSV